MDEHPNGDYYEVYEVDAEIARLKAESDLLKAALRWVFESGAILAVHTVDGVRHPRVVNCGDFDSIEIPPQFAALIAEAVKESSDE